ncbi:MAG: hypothetical protein RIQ88_500 [Actinomycetota bacterium]|jgi:hypothetical protein
MKIQRGKVAILLVVVGMVLPAIFISYKAIDNRAWSVCNATPTAEQDSEVTKDFSWSPLGWVCHKTWTDKHGRPTGEPVDKHIPFIP